MKAFLSALVAWGASGLFFAALLDGAGLPIPGGVDALIIYLAGQRPEEFWTLIAVAVLGSVLGNTILFLLARRGGEIYLERHAASARQMQLRRWFHHYGLMTVFVAALVPLPIMPMKIFVVCAGALGDSLHGFVLVFLAGRIGRYFALALLGRQMGSDALSWLKTHALLLTLGALAMFTVLYLMIKLADRRRVQSGAAQ